PMASPAETGRKSARLAEARVTAQSRDRASRKPIGWTAPRIWIGSRSQLVRSTGSVNSDIRSGPPCHLCGAFEAGEYGVRGLDGGGAICLSCQMAVDQDDQGPPERPAAGLVQEAGGGARRRAATQNRAAQARAFKHI